MHSVSVFLSACVILRLLLAAYSSVHVVCLKASMFAVSVSFLGICSAGGVRGL